MRQFWQYAFLGTLSLLLSLPTAGAETTPEEDALDWYQIELLIFRHKGQPDDELWDEELNFSYPASISGLREDGVLYKSDLEALINREPITVPADFPEESDVAEPEIQAFVRLPSEDRLLHEDRLRLGRSGGHELLFYEAWRQPLIYQPEKDTLLITAGPKSGDHSVLEGYISLSRTRFIHLDINLLLNTFAESGLSEPVSITLPEVPSVMEEATPQDLPLFDLSELARRHPSGDSDAEEWGPEPTPVTVALDDSGLPVVIGENFDAAVESDQNEDLDPGQPAVVVVEAKNIRHQRRLRSKELHYLDHPSIGVLFFATPWKPEPQETVNAQ